MRATAEAKKQGEAAANDDSKAKLLSNKAADEKSQGTTEKSTGNNLNTHGGAETQAAKEARKVNSFVVNVPKATDISLANRAARILSPGITFSAVLSGALNDVVISGTVSE